MYYSIGERAHRLLGKKIGSKDDSDILQTRLWLENILSTYRINRHELSKKILTVHGARTGIILCWLKGKYAVKERHVSLIAGIYEGSDQLYGMPVFELLRNKPISKAKLKKLMSPYLFTNGGLEWWIFPDPTHPESMGIPFAPCLIDDAEGLVERGDIWGFTAILYLVRMAEASNSHKHLNYMKYAYQALPGLCRDRRFLKRWREVLDCLKKIHYRNLTTMQFLRPLESVIERQIYSKQHITRRLLRPRDPETWRYTELEAAYEIAGF